MIDDLYNRKRDFIEENMEEYYDGLTPGDLARLHRWLNVEDDDRRITNIKDELRELLFNKKDISEQNEKIVETQDLDDEPDETYILIKAKKSSDNSTKTIKPIGTVSHKR